MIDTHKPYAVELIDNVLGDKRSLPGGSRAIDIARAFMPYRIERLSDGRCLPLNRDYKPLGIRHGAWAVYESPSYASLCLEEGDLDLSLLKNGGYFFNDGNSPLYKPTTAERNVYLFKLFWTFRYVGFVWPNIAYESLNAVSKATGIEVDTMLDAMQTSKWRC